jgi:hypothetical protein
MNILLNSNSINSQLTEAQTLKNLAFFIADNHLGSDSLISTVSINNEEIHGSQIYFDNRIIQPNDQIHFFTQNRLEILFNLLDKGSLYLDQLIEKTTSVSALYAQNDLMAADHGLLELLETLDMFIQLMTNVHRTIRIELSTKLPSGQSFHDLEIHLLSVLKATLQAKEKQDTIMLYDLIEYELLDNLKQWKIMAIPQLKNLKQV